MKTRFKDTSKHKEIVCPPIHTVLSSKNCPTKITLKDTYKIFVLPKLQSCHMAALIQHHPCYNHVNDCPLFHRLKVTSLQTLPSCYTQSDDPPPKRCVAERRASHHTLPSNHLPICTPVSPPSRCSYRGVPGSLEPPPPCQCMGLRRKHAQFLRALSIASQDALRTLAHKTSPS